MSLSFSRYVRFIFHIPFFRCESFPYISRRADWFPCPLFPFHSPCTPLFSFLSLSCPFQFSFVSLSFPLLSCHVDFLFLPLISLHFLAFPICSPVFPAKNDLSSVFAKRTSNYTELFPVFRLKEAAQTSKEPAGGFEPGTPVLRHQLPVCEMASNYRAGKPPRKPGGGGVGLRGCCPRYPTRLRNVGGYFWGQREIFAIAQMSRIHERNLRDREAVQQANRAGSIFEAGLIKVLF